MKLLRVLVVCLAGVVMAGVAGVAQTSAPVTGAELDHLALQVYDLEKSATFYEKVMGLERIPEPFHDGRHVWMKLGPHLALHLITPEVPVPIVEHPIELHFCLRVASLEEFMRSLDRMHVAYRDMKGDGKMQTRADGVKQTYLKDPDGYWIEVNDAKY